MLAFKTSVPPLAKSRSCHDANRARSSAVDAYPAAGAMSSIPQLDRQPAQSAPLLGQHSDEILESVLGLSASAIAALHDKGIIAQA